MPVKGEVTFIGFQRKLRTGLRDVLPGAKCYASVKRVVEQA